MNLRQFDLNLLTVFDAVLKEGSVTRAAERIGMSQPAASSALGRLREQVGDELFVRTAGGMAPTRRARRLAGPVRQALDLVQTGLQENTAFDYAEAERTFTVAMPDYGEVVIIPRLVDWLRRVAPGVSLRVVPALPGRLAHDLHLGDVDLALDYVPVEGDELHRQRVAEARLVTIAARGHPDIGDTLDLETFLEQRHVIFTPRAPGGTIVQRTLEAMGRVRRVALQIPNFVSMPIIVSKSELLATLPARVARTCIDLFEPERFGLKLMAPPLELPSIPVYLLWHDATDADPGHRWLRKSLRDLCQRL